MKCHILGHKDRTWVVLFPRCLASPSLSGLEKYLLPRPLPAICHNVQEYGTRRYLLFSPSVSQQVVQVFSNFLQAQVHLEV